MKDETILKIFALGCGTVIVITALTMGYDGHLAAGAVAALWGGEKVLEKIGRKE